MIDRDSFKQQVRRLEGLAVLYRMLFIQIKPGTVKASLTRVAIFKLPLGAIILECAVKLRQDGIVQEDVAAIGASDNLITTSFVNINDFSMVVTSENFYS